MQDGRWSSKRGFTPGAERDAVGRARRHGLGDDEVWLLPAEDARLARRLVALGEDCLGGFTRGGADDTGSWLVRRTPPRTLDGLQRGERWPWQEALTVVRDLARGLAACERAGLSPGPLRPAEAALETGHAWVVAESLVRAMVGEGEGARAARSSRPSPRWTPPEQAAGAAWDNAANRYVLGLMAYRLLAGTHPFGMGGLRHALAEQAAAGPGAGPPPFEEEVARELKPGVQTFVLQMLAPAAGERPGDAAAIVARCEALLTSGAEATAPAAAASATAPHRGTRLAPTAAATAVARNVAAAGHPPGGRRAGGAMRRSPPARTAALFAPLVVAAVAAAAALAARAALPREDAFATARVRPMAPLAATTAADCASCHARQAAEWQRSVMAHAVKSPLFGALESLVEEQVGRDDRCPNGAGILRKAGGDTCRDPRTGLSITGSGGEHWCVNCHAMGENLRSTMPAWSAFGSATARAPVRDLLATSTMEGISCAGCHQTIGPVGPHGAGARAAYEGNPFWISPVSGRTFSSRPEDLESRFGISNSGYRLDPSAFLGVGTTTLTAGGETNGSTDPGVHRHMPTATGAYLRSSEFCGACHDVRLFGTDSIGIRERGEHFKRLRNAYSEWRSWAETERRAGRAAATCQDCHMSLYPGVCLPDTAGAPGDGGCPPGTRFEARPAGAYPQGLAAPSSAGATRSASHYFTSVDLPLAETFPEAWVVDPSLDPSGMPVGLRARRDMLLRHTFRFAVGPGLHRGGALEVPVVIENTGAGHRVPAGFSQEREIWVELSVRDGRGELLYEVGAIASDDADLRDKVFLRVNTSEGLRDGAGRPQGMFGADVVDGPDVPAWRAEGAFADARQATAFRGRGLINLQNGFLRCVRCIGVVDAAGRCQPGPDQGRTRADRFTDAAYDPDTGACSSNLGEGQDLFETYFPLGALDADRGIAKAPDAIIDTRSAPPSVPLTYTYVLDVGAHPPPFEVRARLRFRSFPPFLVRAFAAYEGQKAAQGLRPSGPQVTERMLRRLEVIDLATGRTRVD